MTTDQLKKTKATVAAAASKSSTAILFWSATGKDSIVLMHMLQPHFKKIVCVFAYHVKGLDIPKPFFKWALAFGNVEIVEVPHVDLYLFKKTALYALKPDNNFRKITWRDIEEWAKIKYDTDVVIYGMKLSDSFVRRGMFTKAAKSDIHFDYDKYYPIVNWSNKDCLNYIKLNQLPLPLKLGSKRASSGISLRMEVIEYLKKHHPSDYVKIITEYPLLEAKLKHGNN